MQYCDFILHDCTHDFTQEDIRHGQWRKKMVLSIFSINDDDNNNNNNVSKCFERLRPEILSTLTWNRGTKQHVEIPDYVLSKICDENPDCNFECNDNCNGKEKYNNKRIQCKQ